MIQNRLAKAAAAIAISLGALLAAPAVLSVSTPDTAVNASFGWGG